MSEGSPTSLPTEIGGLSPPSGINPNFADPYSIARSIIAGSALCLALATITTVIRLYTKLFIIKSHGWEDYTMFLAWGGLPAYIGLGFPSLKYGAGIHQWDVPITKLTDFARWGNVPEILYPLIIAATKLSICLQFIRLFVVGRGRSFWFIQVFIWVNMMYFAACLFISIFQCVPRAKVWNPELPGSCVDYQTYILVTGFFNCGSDLLMLLFPLVCVLKLQMSTKRKLGLSAVFLIGTLALVASIMRVVFSAINNGSHDETFQLTRVAQCTIGEIAAGITAGNLVVSPRFFSIYSSKLRRFFSNLHTGRSIALLDDTSPSKTVQSRHTRNIELSATRSAQCTTGTMPGDYLELNGQRWMDPAITSQGFHLDNSGHTVRGGKSDYEEHSF